MNEIKKIRARLKGSTSETTKNGKTKTTLIFDSPDGGKYDLKVSLFKGPPRLQVGAVYDMDVEYIPIPDGSGHYKNLVETNGKYHIREVQEKNQGSVPKPLQRGQIEARKEQREIERDPKIRQDCLNYATNLVAAVIAKMPVVPDVGSQSRVVMEIADRYARYVETGTIPDAPAKEPPKKEGQKP